MSREESSQYHEGPLARLEEPKDTLIFSRNDVVAVHDWARANCEPRDYLLIRLTMKIGLRTGEICTLRIENINFEKRTFKVLDSKRKKLYPLPLDPVTLELIRALAGERSEGYVFRQQRSWKYIRSDSPLRTATVWVRVRTIAKEAGVDEDFNPRILRHFFAAEWHESGKSLEVLRRILRHKSLAYTQFYLARLVYFEDVQSAYDEVMNGPLAAGKEVRALTGPCADCSIASLCKYVGSLPEYALGCRYKPAREINVIEHAPGAARS